MALEISKHKNILLKILKDIYSDIEIAPILGFKGGTMAYLFYGLSRFSLDLDFDLLDERKKELVFEKIFKIAKDYGKIKEKTIKRFSIFILLSYEEKAPNIKLQINLRDFGFRHEIKSYLGISMKVMVLEDLVSHKLVAMFERLGKANRDLFDAWYFLRKDFPVNRKIVEKRTGLKFKEFLEKCLEKLEKLSEKGILAGMGELLDEKTKTWAKKNLKNDLLFLLKLKLENL